jgi:hypothetical protein
VEGRNKEEGRRRGRCESMVGTRGNRKEEVRVVEKG